MKIGQYNTNRSSPQFNPEIYRSKRTVIRPISIKKNTATQPSRYTHMSMQRRCSKKDLTELESVLFAGELEVAADEYDHAAGGAGGLAVDGGDGVLALLEGEAGELGGDVLGALERLTLESQHRTVLVEVGKASAVGVERRVVVLHERFRYGVRIHLGLPESSSPSLSLSLSLRVCDKLLIGSPDQLSRHSCPVSCPISIA